MSSLTVSQSLLLSVVISDVLAQNIVTLLKFWGKMGVLCLSGFLHCLILYILLCLTAETLGELKTNAALRQKLEIPARYGVITTLAFSPAVTIVKTPGDKN